MTGIISYICDFVNLYWTKNCRHNVGIKWLVVLKGINGYFQINPNCIEILEIQD